VGTERAQGFADYLRPTSRKDSEGWELFAGRIERSGADGVVGLTPIN
jgi:hypothetical protein